ncbi:hypothetical protein ACLKA6_015694 [Drosophila palustris]
MHLRLPQLQLGPRHHQPPAAATVELIWQATHHALALGFGAMPRPEFEFELEPDHGCSCEPLATWAANEPTSDVVVQLAAALLIFCGQLGQPGGGWLPVTVRYSIAIAIAICHGAPVIYS